MSNINFLVDIPSLPPNSYSNNYRLNTVKKNLLNDILAYNLHTSQQHRKYKYEKSIHDMQQSKKLNEEAVKQMQIDIEMQRKRKNTIRQTLKREYDQQINSQKQIKERQKQQDYQYQKIQFQSNKFQDQRRMYDLMRMYRGSKFQVTQNSQSYPQRNKSTRNNNRNNAIKTQPSEQINQLNKRQMRSLEYYNNRHYQNSSLNKLNMNQNPETPKKVSFKINSNLENYNNNRKDQAISSHKRNLSFNAIQDIKIQPIHQREEIDSLDYMKYLQEKKKRQYRRQLEDQIQKNRYEAQKFNQY